MAIVLARSAGAAKRFRRAAVRAASYSFFGAVAVVVVAVGAVLWVLAVVGYAVLNALVTISRNPVAAALFFGLLGALAAVLVLGGSGVGVDACAAALPTRVLGGSPGTFPAGRDASGGAFLPFGGVASIVAADVPARLAGVASPPAGRLPAGPRAGRGDLPHLPQPLQAAEREAEPVGGRGAPRGPVVVLHP